MSNFFAAEGNLGNKPTLKYVPIKNSNEQKAVLEFDARFNVDKINKATGTYEDTGGFWATVEFWGKRAEHYNNLLQQGTRVLVVGRLSQGEFIATKGDREGERITTNTITADHIGLVLLGVESITYSPRKNKAGDAQHQSDSFEHANSEIPLTEEYSQLAQETE